MKTWIISHLPLKFLFWQSRLYWRLVQWWRPPQVGWIATMEARLLWHEEPYVIKFTDENSNAQDIEIYENTVTDCTQREWEEAEVTQFSSKWAKDQDIR